ncbi:MAG: late competence development ComFB family protein [Tissierellia bacterium]|nr:late competence development ComFB family protein [Tissierellia bacterium]
MVQNYMEILVDDIFQDIRHICSNCTNPNYERDVKSTALNNLPPVYFLSNATDAEKKAFLLDRQRRISVLAALTQASELVCERCRCEKKMRESI